MYKHTRHINGNISLQLTYLTFADQQRKFNYLMNTQGNNDFIKDH